MEIDISKLKGLNFTKFLHPFPQNEDACKHAWKEALWYTFQHPILTNPEDREGMRELCDEKGVIVPTTNPTQNKLDALFLQLVAVEVLAAGAEKIEDINWGEYDKKVEDGFLPGHLFHGDRKGLGDKVFISLTP